MAFVNGREYTVHPNVFSPALFPATEWFANVVTANVEQGSKFIEIGAGCGAILIEVMLNRKCSFAVGSDVLPVAV